jgi:hypothetical protein
LSELTDPTHTSDTGGHQGAGQDAEMVTLPLGSTAALVGQYRWIESALYRLLG